MSAPPRPHSPPPRLPPASACSPIPNIAVHCPKTGTQNKGGKAAAQIIVAADSEENFDD